MTRNAIITTVILVLIGGIAAWSKLRFIDGEAYDAPQRWRVEDYPMPGVHPDSHVVNPATRSSGS
jgi:hypothetical protein